jgi:hypothetical protein
MNPLAPASTIAPRHDGFQAGRWARIGVAVVAAILAARPTPAADPPEGVMPIADVKGLEPQELLAHPPFRIRGVVTWRAGEQIVVQDETTAMYCYRKAAPGAEAALGPAIEPGMEVEVTGGGERGGFGPRLRIESVRLIGPGRLPEPRDVDPVKASEGAHDTELVRLTGVVLGSKPEGISVRLLMEAEGMTFTASFRREDLPCDPADSSMPWSRSRASRVAPLAAQEAIRNAVHHAECARVDVRRERRGDAIGDAHRARRRPRLRSRWSRGHGLGHFGVQVMRTAVALSRDRPRGQGLFQA